MHSCGCTHFLNWLHVYRNHFWNCKLFGFVWILIFHTHWQCWIYILSSAYGKWEAKCYVYLFVQCRFNSTHILHVCEIFSSSEIYFVVSFPVFCIYVVSIAVIQTEFTFITVVRTVVSCPDDARRWSFTLLCWMWPECSPKVLAHSRLTETESGPVLFLVITKFIFCWIKLTNTKCS